MIWRLSHRFDPRACAIADRHYSRQKIGSPQFVRPGRNIVLLAGPVGKPDALWVTSWQDPELVKHEWPGAWECTLFRNEGGRRASVLIRQAIAATRAMMGEPPPLGMLTLVKASAVRKKANPGHCFIIAGFRPVGKTKRRGLLALLLDPKRMPAAELPVGAQFAMPIAA